jgi:3-oxoacyl-[acyl-carrier protein] reductase
MQDHRVALISGASRGIGRSIALQLAADGCDVAIVYAGNQQAAETTKEMALTYGVKAECYCCDVSDYAETETLVKKVTQELGKIDILVNNAGITCDKLVMQMKEQDFDRVLDVNLKGAFNLIKHTSRAFLRAKQGRIVNITSVAGIMGNAGQANYAAAKAGLIGLTKSVAKELSSRGITCNAVAPGIIHTDMVEAMNESARAAIIESVPMRRCGLAEEVAAAVSFFASRQAGYITGAVLPVDGGLSM